VADNIHCPWSSVGDITFFALSKLAALIPRRKVGALRDSDVLLFVCSFVRLSVANTDGVDGLCMAFVCTIDHRAANQQFCCIYTDFTFNAAGNVSLNDIKRFWQTGRNAPRLQHSLPFYVCLCA